MIESRVICLWERYDELPGALIRSIHFDTGLTQSARVHQGDELEEKVGLSLEEFRGLALDGFLEFFGL